MSSRSPSASASWIERIWVISYLVLMKASLAMRARVKQAVSERTQASTSSTQHSSAESCSPSEYLQTSTTSASRNTYTRALRTLQPLTSERCCHSTSQCLVFFSLKWIWDLQISQKAYLLPLLPSCLQSQVFRHFSCTKPTEPLHSHGISSCSPFA